MIINFINGKFSDFGTSGILDKINPSDEEVISHFCCTNIDGVNNAVQCARNSFDSWRKMSRIKRGELFDNLAQLIKRNVDHLARIISLETGKNINEATAEVNESLHNIQYCCGLSRMPSGEVVDSEINSKKIFVERCPKGIVLIISPFNFPLAIPFCWSAGPALLEGNTVIIKPSEFTPMITDTMIRLYQEAGFPDGVINVVYGDKNTSSLLVEHKDINCVLFTGSYRVGQQIKEACVTHWNKSVHLECGSKTAIIVNDDFDIDKAVEMCIPSVFKLAGQRCVSTSRILVHENIAHKFSRAFSDVACSLSIGDPLLENPYYGPVINEQAVSRVLYFNKQTALRSVGNENHKVLMNGERVDRKGYFITPHVYSTEWDNSEYLREECFGPHCAIVPFYDINQAIKINNDVDYGLAVSVLTNNFKVAKLVQDNAYYGIGYWNCPSIGSESHVNFTATRKSGNCSSAAGTIDSVTFKRTWTVNYGDDFQFAQGMK